MPENCCRTRRREEAESFSKKHVKVTSVAWQLHATLHATPHATLHTTLHATLPNCWQGRHFGALRLLRNKMKIQVSFFCPDLKCSSWQHFGSVACSVACSVVCSVAWVLRVVCSVACGGCHVAHFASCSAVCRWRVKHTGGTIRRTDDGFHPLEVAGDGKKFARPKIYEILFFLRWVEEILHHLYNLRFANA